MATESKYYVTATDKVWRDKMIAVCDTFKRAIEIEDKWNNLSDKTHVNIRFTKPYYKGRQVWYDKNLEVIKEIY